MDLDRKWWCGIAISNPSVWYMYSFRKSVIVKFLVSRNSDDDDTGSVVSGSVVTFKAMKKPRFKTLFDTWTKEGKAFEPVTISPSRNREQNSAVEDRLCRAPLPDTLWMKTEVLKTEEDDPHVYVVISKTSNHLTVELKQVSDVSDVSDVSEVSVGRLGLLAHQKIQGAMACERSSDKKDEFVFGQLCVSDIFPASSASEKGKAFMKQLMEHMSDSGDSGDSGGKEDGGSRGASMITEDEENAVDAMLLMRTRKEVEEDGEEGACGKRARRTAAAAEAPAAAEVSSLHRILDGTMDIHKSLMQAAIGRCQVSSGDVLDPAAIKDLMDANIRFLDNAARFASLQQGVAL